MIRRIATLLIVALLASATATRAQAGPAYTIPPYTTTIGQRPAAGELMLDDINAVISGGKISTPAFGGSAHAIVSGEGADPVDLVGPCAVGSVLYGQGSSADPICSAAPTLAALTLSGGVLTGLFNANTPISWIQQNSNSGSIAQADYEWENNLNHVLQAGMLSGGYTTSGVNIADEGYLAANGAGGLLLFTTTPGSGPIKLAAGGVIGLEVMNGSGDVEVYGRLGINASPTGITGDLTLGRSSTSGVIFLDQSGSASLDFGVTRSGTFTLAGGGLNVASAGEDLQSNGHLIFSLNGAGGPSAPSGCGTGASIVAKSNDTIGQVQVGGITTTSCTVDLAMPYDGVSLPVCLASDNAATWPVEAATSLSGSTIKVTMTASGAANMAGHFLTWLCPFQA